MHTRHNWEEGPCLKTFVEAMVSDKSPTTRMQYERCLSQWVEFCCVRWNVSPGEIDFTKCTTYVFKSQGSDGTLSSRMVQGPIQPTVVNEFLDTITSPWLKESFQRCLYRYFDWMYIHGMISTNPVVKLVSRPKPPKQGLPESDIIRLAACLQNEPIHVRVLLSVMFGAALRIKEAISLRLDDLEQVSPGKWIVKVQRESLKTRQAYAKPLPDLGAMLEDYLAWRGQLNIGDNHLFLDDTLRIWSYDRLKLSTPG